jgi:hypothetical protein
MGNEHESGCAHGGLHIGAHLQPVNTGLIGVFRRSRVSTARHRPAGPARRLMPVGIESFLRLHDRR